MKDILVVIDMQNDFINGVLGTKEAVEIVPEVVKKIEAKQKGDTILVTLDTHGENYLSTLEGRKLPVKHCIKGTDGWRLNPEIHQALQEAEDRGVFVKFFEKPTFGSQELANWWITPEEGIEICGLVFSICVTANALLLKAKHPNTEIQIDLKATADINKESFEAAKIVLQNQQIDLI